MTQSCIIEVITKTIVVLIAVSNFGASGCEVEEDSEQVLSQCNPLKEKNREIVLNNVLAIGRDASGIVYLLDDPGDGEYMIFVSDEDILYRKVNLGGNQDDLRGIGTFHNLEFRDGIVESTLIIEIYGNGQTKMGLVKDDYLEGRIEDLGDQVEVLEVLDESVIEHMKVEDLPGIIGVEYFAEMDDGKLIVVTEPEHDFGGDYDFILFYGTKDNMEQKEVTSASRASDGGSTSIDFVVDDDIATIRFPFYMIEDDEEPIEEPVERVSAELELNGEKILGIRHPAEELDINSYNFMCRDQ